MPIGDGEREGHRLPFVITTVFEKPSRPSVGRFPSGGLGGDGNWIASKLFLQLEGLEGEVFFNFDPVAKQGEFSEKDAEYNADCAKVLALSLSR